MLDDLRSHERQVYSQGGEDGVIEHIFACIGTTNRYFVEFGAWDGEYWSNTANLRLNQGWSGLLIDGNDERLDASIVKHAWITPDNINDVFASHDVPAAPDFLSIDIDGHEYWVWRALERHRPRVVLIEYNIFFGADVARTIEYSTDYAWDKTTYHGASLAALRKLGREKGYSLIYTDSYAPNAFFVLDEELPPHMIDLPIEQVAHWRHLGIPEDTRHRAWVAV